MNDQNKSGILLTLLFIIGCIGSAHAQKYTAVNNTTEFKKEFSVKSSAISSLKSDFIQEKSISMLDHKIISEGSFIYKKNNKLRMEYRKPYTFIFVMEEDKVTVINNQHKSSVSTGSNKLYRMISQMTVDCVTGNILNSNDFNIEISENATVYHLVLIPHQKMVKSLFGSITIQIAKSDFTVDRLELNETSGDRTILVFSNKKINSPVNDEVFKVN